MTRDTGS
ncbi:hypothetical protein MPLDJ20_20116 [Mesorhizobium plurifarium]|nr:hypothetical protein MPLDJ20_20116 [Mesorhizobium plurifarium]